MGISTARCVKVAELVDELRQYDGDLLVRFRDGDAAHPGVYVMREDRTGYVDVGSPYSAGDGRRPGRGPKVWVLVRRYEWEANAQQTECCDTFVFTSRRGAVRKAASLLRADMGTHGGGFTPSDVGNEERAMLADFRSRFPRHIVQLSQGGNVVYELYGRGVRG